MALDGPAIQMLKDMLELVNLVALDHHHNDNILSKETIVKAGEILKTIKEVELTNDPG